MKATAHPYRVRRVVQWGDCDPAGIIYTPRAVEFGIEALEAWFRDVLEASWASLPKRYGIGSPVVNVACNFPARLPVDQAITITVLVERLGTTSLTFRVTCTDDAAAEFFDLRIVTCCLALPERKPRPVPAALRERIRSYMEACTAAPAREAPGAAPQPNDRPTQKEEP